MGKFYTQYFFIQLFVLLGCFFQVQETSAQVSIIRTSIDDCLQETTLVATGLGPITFRYWRDGKLEAEDIVSTPDANNYYSSTKVVPAGPYIVQAIDRNGAKFERPLDVNIVNPVSVEVLDIIDATCSGEPNGEALIKVTSNLSFVVKLYNLENPDVVKYTFNNTQVLKGIGAGTYLVEVRDLAGCVAFEEITIEEPLPLLLAQGELPTVYDPVCDSDKGRVVTQINGGNGPEYDFALFKNGSKYRDDLKTSGGGKIDIDDLDVGSYYIRVYTNRNLDSRCFEDYPFDIVYNEKFGVEIIPLAISCFGANDGKANINFNGNLKAPIRISYERENGSTISFWQPNTDPIVIEGLFPGNYTATVRDDDGCEMYRAFTIVEPSELKVEEESVIDVCYDGENGSISVKAFGGTAPYKFSLSDDFSSETAQAGTDKTFTGLAAGNYKIYVQDRNGCLAETRQITVNAPANPISHNLVEKINPDCPEAASGVLEVSGTGGWGAPFTYSWTRVGSSNELSDVSRLQGVPAGNYEVTIKDKNGCEYSYIFELEDPFKPEIEILTPSPVTCFGDQDGQIYVKLVGTTAFEISLDGKTFNATEATFANLPAGTYNLRVKIAENCYISRSVTVATPDLLELLEDKVNINPILCFEDNAGSITGLAIKGGTAPYTFQWQKKNTSNVWENLVGKTELDIDQLVAGDYRLLAKDAKGCDVISNPFSLTQPDKFTLDMVEEKDADCYGASTGSIKLVVDGGTAPYYYSLDNGNSYTLFNKVKESNILSLPAGDYTVMVRDENRCTVGGAFTVTIDQPREIKLDGSQIENATCAGANNGKITAEVSGGSGAVLTYAWFKEGYPDIVRSTSLVVDGLEDGNYFLSVKDPTSASCEKIFGPFIIAAPSSIIAVVTPTNVVCRDDASGALEIGSISGGDLQDGEEYVIEWRGPNGFRSIDKNISGLFAGIYTLTISDGKSCGLSKEYEVKQPANKLEISKVTVIEPGCSGNNNGRIEIEAAKGVAPYSYAWAKLNETTNQFEVIAGRTSRILNQQVQKGTYRITVRDDAGCTAIQDIVVNQPEPLAIELVEKDDISCFDINDGYINVDIQGGTLPYTYLWSNGQTNKNVQDLRPGTYTLSVFDKNGCSTSMSFDIKGLVKPEIRELSRTDVVCIEDAGAISIGLANGLNPSDYTIYWKNLQNDLIFGQNQTSVTGLKVGLYQVFVQVEEGCEVNRILKVEGPESPLQLLVAQEDPKCPGLSGAVFLNAKGGFAPYKFFIQMDNAWTELNGSIIGSLDIGDYSVKVTDARGCEDEGNLVITQPNPPSFGADKVQDVSCFGGNDGKIDFSVTGGTHQWFRKIPGQADQPIPDSELNSLIAGTYFMEITFAANCVERDDDIIIAQPPLLTVNVTTIDPVCFGDTGSATIALAGGKDRKTIQLISLATNTVISSKDEVFEEVFVFSELASGNYIFKVLDRGCGVSEYNFTINPVVKPSYTDIEISNISCRGENDGWIKVINPVVNQGRTFKISINGVEKPMGEYLFENLTPNTYTLVVTDSEGCSSESRTITITEPESVEMDNIRYTDPTCFGGDNGIITFRPEGGSMVYTAILTNKTTNQTRTLTNLQESNVYQFDGLKKGAYQIDLRDENSCLTSFEFTLDEPEGFTVAATTGDIICEGGESNARLSFTGGSSPFTIEYRTVGGNWIQLISESRELVIPNLIAGKYEYKVKDAQDCAEQVGTFELIDGEKIQVSAQISPVSCEGRMDGVMVLSASGSRREGSFNYIYFVNGEAIFGNRLTLPAGEYSISAAIGNQESGLCLSEEIIVIVPVVEPMVIEPVISDVSCKGGNDGHILLNITGGNGDYRVEWTHNVQGPELSGLIQGTYTAYVYDGKGCAQTVQIKITEPEEILQASGNVLFQTCEVTTETGITLDVRGGTAPYTFKWSNGATAKDIFDLSAGEYIVEITDAKGCVIERKFDMPASKSVIEVEVGGKLSLCSTNDRAEIRLTVSGGAGGYKYKWSHGPVTPVISNLLPGEYKVEITDADGCTATSTTIIPQADPVRMSISELSNVSCKGLDDGFIKINVSGGMAPYKITWSNGLKDVTEAYNLSPNIYSIRIEDASGCITSTSVTIREPEMLTFSQIIEDSQCAGNNRGAILLTVDGGTAPYSYRWTADAGNPANGATSRNLRNLSPGQYSVMITDRGGCTTGGTFTVSEPDPITIEGTYPKMLACHGADDGYINLSVDGGTQPFNLTWSDNPNITSFNRSNLVAGSYTVDIIDENGCKASKTFVIEEPKPLVANLFTRIDIDCETRDVLGTAWVIVEGGTGEYEVRWHSGEANVREVNFTEPGDITVYVKDVNGCNIDVSRTVNFPPLFADSDFNYSVISLEGEGEVLIHDPVQFNDMTTGNVIAWEWEFGDGKSSSEQNPKHSYSSPGLYEVKLKVFDTYGCSSLSTIEVEVTSSYRILIPNAFTPNGDNLNDYFLPKFRGISEFEMHIFNTWGDLLYSAYSMEDPGWDGYNKGRISPNGNYVYKVFFTTREGERKSKSGVFLLIN